MLVGEVGGARVCSGSLGGVKAGVGGLSSDLAGDLGGFAGEDVLGVASDPQLGGGIALAVKGSS